MDDWKAHFGKSLSQGDKDRLLERGAVMHHHVQPANIQHVAVSELEMPLVCLVAIHGLLASGVRLEQDALNVPPNPHGLELMHEICSRLPHDLRHVVEMNEQAVACGGPVALPRVNDRRSRAVESAVSESMGVQDSGGVVQSQRQIFLNATMLMVGLEKMLSDRGDDPSLMKTYERVSTADVLRIAMDTALWISTNRACEEMGPTFVDAFHEGDQVCDCHKEG